MRGTPELDEPGKGSNQHQWRDYSPKDRYEMKHWQSAYLLRGVR
jgi:hypothetical protein